MADKLTEFMNAKNAAFDKLAALRPALLAIEKELNTAEDLGRDAGIKASAVRASLPRLTYQIGWPEGLEPPMLAQSGGLLAAHEVGTVRRALALAKTDPEGFDVIEMDRLIEVFAKADAAMIYAQVEG